MILHKLACISVSVSRDLLLCNQTWGLLLTAIKVELC